MEIQLIFSGESCRAPIICALELLLEVKLHVEKPIKSISIPAYNMLLTAVERPDFSASN